MVIEKNNALYINDVDIGYYAPNQQIFKRIHNKSVTQLLQRQMFMQNLKNDFITAISIVCVVIVIASLAETFQ